MAGRRFGSFADLDDAEAAKLMQKGYKWNFRHCNGQFCSAQNVVAGSCNGGCNKSSTNSLTKGSGSKTSASSTGGSRAKTRRSSASKSPSSPSSSSATPGTSARSKKAGAPTRSSTAKSAKKASSPAPVPTRTAGAKNRATPADKRQRAEAAAARRRRAADQSRADWDGYEQSAYDHAEDATRGNMQRRGARSSVLGIYWPSGRRPWRAASEELGGYWDGGGMVPVTLTEYKGGKRRPRGRPWEDTLDRRRKKRKRT